MKKTVKLPITAIIALLIASSSAGLFSPAVKPAFAVTASAAETKISAPAEIKSISKNDTLTLTWKAADGADAYRVYMYNESDGEFEKYKTVSSTSCNITGLKKGKDYKFRIASLVKKDGKYIEQKKTGILTVSLADKPVTGSKQEPSDFKAPLIGDNSKHVLATCGIGKYSSENVYGNMIEYTGDVYYSKIKSIIILDFNTQDQLCDYVLFIPAEYSEYIDVLSELKKENGNKYKLQTDSTSGDLQYVWKKGTKLTVLQYSYDSDCIILGYYDINYAS